MRFSLSPLRRASSTPRLDLWAGILLLLTLSFVHGQASTSSSSASPSSSGSSSSSSVTNAPSSSGTTPTATGSSSAGNGNSTATGSSAVPSPSVNRNESSPLSQLTMDTPKASQLNPPIFSIGTDLRFSWHYDNYLLLRPANLTIEAFLVSSPNTIYPIVTGLAGTATNYTWTGIQQTANVSFPLQVAMYNLRIFDGQVGRNGVLPAGGYLQTYSGLVFGMYKPETYIPGGDQNPPVCAKCSFASVTNSAMSLNQAPSVVVGMVLISAILAMVM